MAENEFPIHVKIDVTTVNRSRDEATKALDDITGSAIGLNQALELIQKGFALLKTAVTLPINQFKSLLGVSVDLVNIWDEEIVAQTKLANVLRATGQGGADQAKKFIDLASSLQQVTRFGDDAIVSGQAFAVGAGVQADQLERFTRAAVDLAAQLGGDVQDGFRKLNLAVQTGSIRGFRSDISTAKDATVRFNEVLSFVEQNLNGTAEALAKVGAGPLEQLKNVFNDFQEKLGDIISSSPKFQEFIDNVKGSLEELIKFIDQNRDRLTTLFGNLFVASLNVAKAAVVAFANVVKAAFEGILDLFLQVAGTKIGSALGLDEGLGDIQRYREEVEKLANLEEAFAENQQRLVGVREKALDRFEKLAASTNAAEKKDLQELIRLDIDRLVGIETTIEKQSAALIKSRDEVENLRSEVLGLSQEGSLAGLITAAEQFNLVIKDGRVELEAVMARLNGKRTGDGGAAAEFARQNLGRPIEEIGGDGASALDKTPGQIDVIKEKFVEFSDLIQSTQQMTVQGIDAMVSSLTNAIVDFTMTGKANIADFARSFIAEIEAMIVKALILNAIEGALGGTSLGNFLRIAAPARAAGGPTMPARSYLVGERGPERFTPNRPGRIESADASSTSQALNIRIVDARTRSEIDAAVASGRFANEVVAVIQDRRTSIAGILP